MDAAALMEELEAKMEGARENARKARKLAHGAESRSNGIEQAMELIQQYIDDAEEIADGAVPLDSRVYIGCSTPTGISGSYGFLRRTKEGKLYLSAIDPPVVLEDADEEPHYPDEALTALPDDEMPIDDVPVLECDSHLTFEELAEGLRIGLQELLRRAREDPDAVCRASLSRRL